MRILVWAGLSVLVACHGHAELATLAIVLLTTAGGRAGRAGPATAGRRALTGDRPLG